jgi:hypothetical protein
VSAEFSFTLGYSTEQVTAALQRAAVEYGLQDYYIDIARPLLHMPKEQWPMCCGGGCEPCQGTITAVAERTIDLLALSERNPEGR